MLSSSHFFSANAPTQLLPLEVIAGQVPVQRVEWQPFSERGIEFWIRRDDCLPDWCQGNKFYKLYHNFHAAPVSIPLLSFGGAYSNHLHALALFGQKLKRRTMAIVRGERPQRLSPTLLDAQAAGMQLFFVSRIRYRELNAKMAALVGVVDLDLEAEIESLVGAKAWIIPEGGANFLGARGCQAIAQATTVRAAGFTEICLALGTGTTLAGIASAVDSQVLGVSVLGDKNHQAGTTLEQDVENMLLKLGSINVGNWQIARGYHHGGYAKASAALIEFMGEFEAQTKIPLDQVYTAKLFWALAQLAVGGRWRRGEKVLAIHSGGLQGRRGEPRLLNAEPVVA